MEKSGWLYPIALPFVVCPGLSREKYLAAFVKPSCGKLELKP
jgi:hypothetical protein